MPSTTVNPTRMELTRLKGRLKTAQRGHKLLKDKRDELMKQFMDVVRENRALRERVETALMAAEELYLQGVSNVFISLGDRGAVYCGELGKCFVGIPSIVPLSTVGAGDSTVAGFIAGYMESPTMKNCAATACAYGTACCLEPGTNPPTPENIAAIKARVIVTPA